MNYVNHFRSLERQFGPAGEYSIVEAMTFYVLEDRMPTHDADRCKCYFAGDKQCLPLVLAARNNVVKGLELLQ